MLGTSFLVLGRAMARTYRPFAVRYSGTMRRIQNPVSEFRKGLKTQVVATIRKTVLARFLAL
jgi:hypothetical protein